MSNTIKLINISITTHSYDIVCVVRTLNINSLIKFQVHNTALLTTVTMMYISYPELIHLTWLNLCTLELASPHLSHLPATVSVSLTLLDSTYKWDHAEFLSVSGLFL